MNLNRKVIIIAEAGVNHNGSLRIAKKLVDKAVEAKADFIKFQTFNAGSIATIKSSKANYQKKNSSKSETQLQMLKKLELNEKKLRSIYSYCKNKKIGFMSSPFDLDSLNILKNFKMKFLKIPSGEITNLPLLEEIGKSKKRVILSTGMANIAEIKKALFTLTKFGLKKKEIILLHCNTEYPTPFKDANLKAIHTLKNKFKLNVGYSDHTTGIEASIAAVALGAKVIEKHFTLSKNFKGPDHSSSLEPIELSHMIRAIRNIEHSLGNGEKKPSLSEKKNIKIVRKSIVAKKEIFKGQIFSVENLAVKRPFKGISPMKWYKVIGKKAKKNYRPDDFIKLKNE